MFKGTHNKRFLKTTLMNSWNTDGALTKCKRHLQTFMLPPPDIKSGLPFVSYLDPNQIVSTTKICLLKTF